MNNKILSLIILLLFSLTSWCQFKTIKFNADGFDLKVNRETISNDLTGLLGISKDFSFKLQNEKTITDKLGQTHYTYQQFYKGYAIEQTAIKLHYNEGQLIYLNGEYLDIANIKSVQPTLLEKQALEKAIEYTNAELYIWDSPKALERLPKNKSTELLLPAPHGELVIYCPKARVDSLSYFAYKFDIYATKPISRNYIYVDAITGKVVGKEQRMHSVNGTADTRYSGERVIGTDAEGTEFRLRDYDSGRGDGIETYNMETGTDIGNAIEFTDVDNDWTTAEFDNTDKDNAALDAHWGAMMVYDYFLNVHGRNSIDNAGGVLQNYVHYDVSWDNAQWDGTAMLYGDGGTDFSVLTCIDVIGHEIGHGLDQNTSNLVYQNESGAIDESLADIWGACVEAFATDGKETWLLADEIDIRTGHIALRSMSNPNDEGQPDTYGGTNWCDYADNNLLCTVLDVGGVHTNSGVMNFWFFLLSQGGSGTNDISSAYNVAAIGMEDAASIVFRAETVYFTSNTTYSEARSFTIQAAQDIFGNCSPEVISTINAWFAVGVGSAYLTLSNLDITLDFSDPHTEDFYATELLEASNTVGTNTNIRYQSSGAVVMLPDFMAESGSNFVAEIIPCVDLSSAKNDGPSELRVTNASAKQKPTQLSQFKIFPNPTEESLNILFLSENFQKADIKITDASNRLVKSFQILSKLSEINLGELASGMYFVSIILDDKILTTKLIKN